MIKKIKLISIYLIISIFCSTRMSSQTIQWENTIGGNDTEWVDFIEFQKMRIIFWEAIHTLIFLVIRMRIREV
jgi:hypothetical protein